MHTCGQPRVAEIAMHTPGRQPKRQTRHGRAQLWCSPRSWQRLKASLQTSRCTCTPSRSVHSCFSSDAAADHALEALHSGPAHRLTYSPALSHHMHQLWCAGCPPAGGSRPEGPGQCRDGRAASLAAPAAPGTTPPCRCVPVRGHPCQFSLTALLAYASSMAGQQPSACRSMYAGVTRPG